MIYSLIYHPAFLVILSCLVFPHVDEEQHICNDLHLSGQVQTRFCFLLIPHGFTQ